MSQHSLIVRAVWFVLVGWWATPLLLWIAWLFNISIVLLPVGIKLINMVPFVLTLAEPERVMDPDGGSAQHPLWLRGVWFVFVGWWLSFIWSNVAALVAITIIGLPVTIWMVNRLPFVVSLYKFHG